MAGMMRDRIVQSEMKALHNHGSQDVISPFNGSSRMLAQHAAQQPPGQGVDQVPVPQQMF
jgi:hypothetical protein